MSTSSPSAPATETPTQHDAKGRFVRGNSGGPGNPFARQVAELRQALLDAVTADKMRRLVEALLERAMNGDNGAARLVLQYTLGKPAATVEPDRVDVDEYRLREEAAIPPGQWLPMLNQLPASTINDLTDRIQPFVERGTLEAFAAAMKPDDGTPVGRRTARKAMKRLFRAMNVPTPPSTNGSDGRGSKLQFDRYGFPLDMGIDPYRAG
jgi:hypothetical protein